MLQFNYCTNSNGILLQQIYIFFSLLSELVMHKTNKYPNKLLIAFRDKIKLIKMNFLSQKFIFQNMVRIFM